MALESLPSLALISRAVIRSSFVGVFGSTMTVFDRSWGALKGNPYCSSLRSGTWTELVRLSLKLVSLWIVPHSCWSVTLLQERLSLASRRKSTWIFDVGLILSGGSSIFTVSLLPPLMDVSLFPMRATSSSLISTSDVLAFICGP